MPQRRRATASSGVPVTARGDKSTGRVIALVVLLLAAGAMTRGQLPGVTPGPGRPGAGGPAESIVMAALLALSAGAVAVAFVHRVRHRRATAGSMGELSTTAGAHRGRPAWRAMLIALAVVVLWLLGVFVLTKLGGRISMPAQLPEAPGTAPGSGVDVTAPDSAPQSPPRADGSAATLAGYLLAAAVGVLVLFAAVAAAARTRRTAARRIEATAAPVTASAPTAGETLARAAELGLTRIADRSRGPREAIIACYAVMEHHLAGVPDVAPREYDTPTEVLARAVEHQALPADNASRLVALFAEARFSPHLMTEQHRADAVAILQLVLDELRAPR